jgi:predicted transcriptional regulator
MNYEINEKSFLLKRFLIVAYALSEADVDAFLRIVNSAEGKDVDSISSDLGISKSRASLILKKLSDAGLIEKQKSPVNKGGRPKFVYSVNKPELRNKLSKKAAELCQDLQEIVSSV